MPATAAAGGIGKSALRSGFSGPGLPLVADASSPSSSPSLRVVVVAVTGRGPNGCNRGASGACAPVPNIAERRCHRMPFSRRAASSIAALPDPSAPRAGWATPGGLVPSAPRPPVAAEGSAGPSDVHHGLARDGRRPPSAGLAGLDLPAVFLQAGPLAAEAGVRGWAGTARGMRRRRSIATASEAGGARTSVLAPPGSTLACPRPTKMPDRQGAVRGDTVSCSGRSTTRVLGRAPYPPARMTCRGPGAEMREGPRATALGGRSPSQAPATNDLLGPRATWP